MVPYKDVSTLPLETLHYQINITFTYSMAQPSFHLSLDQDIITLTLMELLLLLPQSYRLTVINGLERFLAALRLAQKVSRQR